MYMIRANGEKVKSCKSLREAKKIVKYYKGKITITCYNYVPLPKATMLSYKDRESVKSEIFREIYSENNHGYHFIKRGH